MREAQKKAVLVTGPPGISISEMAFRNKGEKDPDIATLEKTGTPVA